MWTVQRMRIEVCIGNSHKKVYWFGTNDRFLSMFDVEKEFQEIKDYTYIKVENYDEDNKCINSLYFSREEVEEYINKERRDEELLKCEERVRELELDLSVV